MNNLKHRKPWNRSNPSPASLLMESLGAPTDYSSEQIQHTPKTGKQKKARAKSLLARIGRRINRIISGS